MRRSGGIVVRAVHWAPEGAQRTACGQVIDRNAIKHGVARQRRMTSDRERTTCTICRRILWRYDR